MKCEFESFLFVLCRIESDAGTDEAARLVGAEVYGVHSVCYCLPLLAVAAGVEEVVVTSVAYNLQQIGRASCRERV